MPKMRSARRKQKDREKQRSAALESPSALLTYVEQVFTQEVERLAAQKREFDLAYEETVNNLRSEYTKIRAQLENSEVPAQPSTPKHRYVVFLFIRVSKPQFCLQQELEGCVSSSPVANQQQHSSSSYSSFHL